MKIYIFEVLKTIYWPCGDTSCNLMWLHDEFFLRGIKVSFSEASLQLSGIRMSMVLLYKPENVTSILPKIVGVFSGRCLWWSS